MSSVSEASERIESLLDQLAAAAPPAAVERANALVAAVMALYGAGLERTVELADKTAGENGVRALAEDDLVGGLLILHDLHPDSVEVRVQRALDGVRPYLGSHAGGVRLEGVDEAGVVHLRLEGSCEGCAGSTITVRNAIEEAVVAAAPDVTGIETEGVVAPGEPALLQISRYRPEDCPVPGAGVT